MSKPKIDYVKVDRIEYEALCTLRDGVHEKLKLELTQAHENYQACLAVNRDQLSRLNGQLLEVEDLRRRDGALTREVSRLRAELDKYKPATFDTPRPR